MLPISPAPQPLVADTLPAPFGRRSAAVALLLCLAVAAFHFAHGGALIHTVLLQSFNWVFDYDASRFLGGWCTLGADVTQDVDLSFLGRHALSLATRPLCLALLPVAGTPALALMALTALCAGVATALAYALAAVWCATETDRVLLALGYATSIHPLLLGVIPETFGFALCGIGLHFVWLAQRGGQPLTSGPRAAASLFLNLGFTVTNAGLNLVSSAVMSWQRMPWRRWLALEARTWLLACAAMAAVVVASAAIYAPQLLAAAGSTPQHVWWTINMARGETASLAMVVCTFVLYSFVAPALSTVQLAAPDSHPMLDFRSFQFSAIGGTALALWTLAMVLSVAWAWRVQSLRRLLLVVGIWLLINIALHASWQYRGSVFIYGPHTSFALFAVLAMGYGCALRRYAAVRVRAYAAVLVLLTAANNLGLYREMGDFLRQQPGAVSAAPFAPR